MSSKKRLKEGLKEGDLKKLVLPLVSVDEFESKIGKDDDVLVIGFYVEDQDPADDLARFIDRSVHEVIDTDVSPAPTEEGYFMVFVELHRDEKSLKIIMELLDEIQRLVEVDKWQYKAYQVDEVKDLTKENLENDVRIFEDNHEQFEAKKFLNKALVDNIEFHNNFIILESKNLKHIFKIEEFSKRSYYQEAQSPVFEDITLSNGISRLLGNHYDVFVSRNGKIFIHDDNSTLVLQKT